MDGNNRSLTKPFDRTKVKYQYQRDQTCVTRVCKQHPSVLVQVFVT